MNKKGIRCTWSTVGVRSLWSVLFNIFTSVLVPKHSELSYVDNVMVQPLFTSSSQYDCVPVTEISAVNLSQKTSFLIKPYYAFEVYNHAKYNNASNPFHRKATKLEIRVLMMYKSVKQCIKNSV